MKDVLLAALQQCDIPLKRVSEATNIDYGHLWRFRAGTKSLSLEKAETLAVFLGLDLQKRKKVGR